jgi:hypothetical protein
MYSFAAIPEAEHPKPVNLVNMGFCQLLDDEPVSHLPPKNMLMLVALAVMIAPVLEISFTI